MIFAVEAAHGVGTTQVKGIRPSQIIPEFFQTECGLSISRRPQQSDHFPECGYAGSLSFGGRRSLSDDAADDLIKECGVGHAIQHELFQSLSRIQWDVTPLFESLCRIKTQRLQSLRQPVPVRLCGDDNSGITRNEGSADEAAQFLQ